MAAKRIGYKAQLPTARALRGRSLLAPAYLGRLRLCTDTDGEQAADLEALPPAAARLDGSSRRGDNVLHDREPESSPARVP
jgi:hypothetical protein